MIHPVSNIEEPRPVTPYQCPKCYALWLHWPKEQTGSDQDSLNLRSNKSCAHCEPASIEQLQRLERVPAVLKAPTTGMTFGLAIEALKAGKRVARAGWNGKGMWLAYVSEVGYGVGLKVIAPCGSGNSSVVVPDLLPWIGMKTADNGFVPWLASQTDMLAEDWAGVG